MSERKQGERIDTASRVILTTPHMVFRTFLDAEMLKSWRVPEGVRATFSLLKPEPGGGYCLNLHYDDERYGQSAPGIDIIEGRFVEFVADERVVEDVRFVNGDGGTAATMRFETLIEPAQGGIKVTLRASGVPDTIGQAEHREALAASLWRLALLTE